MNASVPFRVGFGTDRHRLGNGVALQLGGVAIPADVAAIGHSDADALLHAITDALLGALALPDIGQMFSDQDPANRGRDSAEFLSAAYDKIRADGWAIANLDAVVHLQRPKLAPHLEAIRQRLAGLLAIEPQQIGLKAKTGEGLDAVGLGQAVDVHCVALLYRNT
jgi:2-C-methyl-D-erythritol 2,4-cyclodiphosphate synthase